LEVVTISLCVIAGNESAHIVRLLDSFRAGFDELSLVIATGSVAPDDTRQLALDWCEAHGKSFVCGTHANHPEAAKWEHVDDFAAARNASFAQASGEWLCWADCDDVIDDAAGLRALVASGRADMYRLPYHVPDAQKLTVRERLLRASLFRDGRIWRWPVHENLLIFAGDKWEQAASPVFTHRPTGAKAGGEKRNLRILTGALRDAPTNYYYCHQENFYLRRQEQARRFGKLFLDLPLRAPVLEYQCLLNMSELSEEKRAATTYALQAHQLFPRQKEAIAALVKCSFQDENSDAALHWSKLLVEAPRLDPQDRLWCYEPKWDGWAAWDLRARALRYAGKDAAADLAQSEIHNGTPIAFSLLHATRGRVNQAIQCREAWIDAADNPAAVEHIFAYDADDAASKRWLKSFQHVESDKSTCVAAWNLAAQASKGQVLIQLSDDWSPVKGWDTQLAKTFATLPPLFNQFAIAINDGTRTDDLLCMAICSRARYEGQGKELFSEEYDGMYSDNEYSYRAYRDGIVIDARHITFTHHHPAFGKAPMDKTYERQNAPEKYRSGLETFIRRNPDAPRQQ
jgi:hypothetical protein